MKGEEASFIPVNTVCGFQLEMACGLSKFSKETVVTNTVGCFDLYIFTCSSTSGILSKCYGRRCSYLFSKCSVTDGDDRALPIGSRHGRHISNFLALFLHLGNSVIFKKARILYTSL